MCCFLFSTNANITIPRPRNTQRSPKNTTGNDPAPDRLVVQNDKDLNLLYLSVTIALLIVLTGFRVRGRGLSQEEKEISVQVSF